MLCYPVIVGIFGLVPIVTTIFGVAMNWSIEIYQYFATAFCMCGLTVIVAICGYGVWFSDNNVHNIAGCDVPGEQSNQRAELFAALRALASCLKLINENAFSQAIGIHTDSQYVVSCMTNWREKWKRNRWRTSNGTPVANRDLIEEISDLMDSCNVDIDVAHIDREYNSGADALSKRDAYGEEILTCYDC